MPRKELRSLCLFFVAYKIIFFILALAGIAVFARLWPQSVEHFCTLLHEWDAKHILRVASQGYLAQAPSIQVFPLMPLLMRAIQWIIPSWPIASVVSAQLASAGAFYYFYKLCELEFLKEDEKNLKWSALIFFGCFPTAYYLSLPYTEAIFCASSFAFVYYYKTSRFKYAFVAGALSTLSRIMGIFLIPALLGDLLFHRKKKSRAEKIGSLVSCAGLVLGFVSYLWLNHYLYGDWFYYTKEQQNHWGVHFSMPFAGAYGALRAIIDRAPNEKWFLGITELMSAVLALAVLPSIIRRKNFFDLIYYICSIGLLFSLNFWVGRLRYLIPLYPVFFVLAKKINGKPQSVALYLLLSCGMFGLFLATYLNAQWTF